MADKIKTNEQRDKLEEEIAAIEETPSGAIKPKLPRTTLEQKTYTPPTDDELKSAAENELGEYKRSGESSLKQKSEAEIEELNAKRTAYADAKANSEAELEKQYQAAARGIDNDVIKRGLARSSIASVEQGALTREYLNKSADVVKQYTANIAKLESDIASVNKKLQDALSDFNLSYATRLTARLNELKAEREQKMEEVIEYNNEIKRKQAALDTDRLKTESDLYTAAINQEKQASSLSEQTAERQEEVYKAVFKKMDEFLGSLDPEVARMEINNHSLYRKHLSNAYYNRLLDKYGRTA